MRNDPRRRGFTLLETMMVILIFTVVIGSTFAFLSGAQDQLGDATRYSTMQSEARTLISWMAEEIRQSADTCPDWSVSADEKSITFNKCLGTDGNAFYWSPAITWKFAPAPGEIDGDGKDNNNNGMVDEGWLQRTEAATPVPAAHWNYKAGKANVHYAAGGWITSTGLTFFKDGRSITITLVIGRYSPRHKQVETAREQTIVALRN